MQEKFCYGEHEEYQVVMGLFPMFPFALKDDKVQWEGAILHGGMKKLKSFFEEGIKVVTLGKVTNFSTLSKHQILMKALCD